MRKHALRLSVLVLVALTAAALPAAAAPTRSSGEPWLALAKVDTETCSDERVFTLSVATTAAVNPWTIEGDLPVWDYAPGTRLPLRLTWRTEHNPPPSAMADSVKIYLRDPDTGAQIGTSVWQENIPQTASGEAIRVIHLDDNPMNGTSGTPRPGLFEVYAKLVGGADDGADTRGASAAGPNCGPGSYARGFLSSGGIKLYDNWNVDDGTSWNTSKWTTTSSGSSRIVDVEGHDGRLRVISDNARATSRTPDVAHADVKLTYRFSDRNSGSDFRISMRGSGASGSSQLPNAYRLDIDSGSSTVKLKKVVDGTASTIGQFTYTPVDTNEHKVRFSVVSSSIKVKIWPAGQTEPSSWSLERTNTDITDPGKLQLTHYYSGSGGARSVFIDNLTLDDDSSAFDSQAGLWDLPPCDSTRTGQTMTDTVGINWTCNGVVWLFAGGNATGLEPPNAPCGPGQDGDRIGSVLHGFDWECHRNDEGIWEWWLVPIV